MASVPEASVPSLYGDLVKMCNSNNRDNDKIVKTANRILQADETEAKAFHCKIVSLIDSERFQDAIGAISKHKDLSKGLTFEKAYSEYRLNRTKDALSTLTEGDKKLDDRCNELLAQVYFRLEQFDKAISIYRALIRNSQDTFDDERLTNLFAVIAAQKLFSDQQKTKLPDIPSNTESFELLYNAGCYFVAAGDTVRAKELLHRSEDLCRQTFDEDPEECDSELAPIRVQEAFVAQTADHDTGHALELYNLVLKQKTSDRLASAVAANNIVTINKEQNIFDSKKKMKAATADSLKQKWAGSQGQTVNWNNLLLMMYSGQIDVFNKLVLSSKAKYPNSEMPSLLQAASFCKAKQIVKAIGELKSALEQVNSETNKMDSQGKLRIVLTLATLYLQQGDINEAIHSLKSLPEIDRLRPGIVSLIISLYISQNNWPPAIEFIDEVIASCRASDPHSMLGHLLRSSANLLMKNGQYEKAAVTLEEVRRSNPKDLKLAAQLIAAYSKFNPKKAQAISKEFPTTEDLAKDVDPVVLEANFSRLMTKKKNIVSSTSGSAGASSRVESPKGRTGDTSSPDAVARQAQELERKRRKKKRKPKLPKDYDPNSTPDPYRWIAKRERPNYRAPKRKAARDVGKGTQGALPTFDQPSGVASSSTSGATPPPSGTSTAPSTAAKSGQTAGASKNAPPSKKKKKRGPKW